MRFVVVCLWIVAILFAGAAAVYWTQYESAAHQIFPDNYLAALENARVENKQLLVNFTGHT